MTADATRTRRTAPVLLTALRPKQWLKNVLVLAAPLGAGQLTDGSVLRASALAAVAFCLAASAGYLLNDVVDRVADRAHPHKRRRPIAAGAVRAPAALAAAGALAAVALVVGVAVRPALGLTVAVYLALVAAYSLWLKHRAWLELTVLAVGFLLRAVAGGAATGLPLSGWFLVVAAAGSLFMAAGKRASELRQAREPAPDGDRPAVRLSLSRYSAAGLTRVWVLAAVATLTAYALWSLDVGERSGVLPWAVLSVLPMAGGVLRYAGHIRRGNAEAPELTVLGDRTLLGLGLVWLVLFWLGARGV